MCALQIPEKCLRGYLDCHPLAQIESDDSVSFICCGKSDEGTRMVKADRFRFCWKNGAVNQRDDLDERDVKDTISVLAQALSVDANMPR